MNRPTPGRVIAAWAFTAPDMEVPVDRLDGIARTSGLSLGPPRGQAFRDVFQDTADWRIRRAHRSLRIREDDGIFEAHLEQETVDDGGPNLRRTFVQPATGPDPCDLLDTIGPVSTRISLICGCSSLRCVGATAVRRTTFEIRVTDGATADGDASRASSANDGVDVSPTIGTMTLDEAILTGSEVESFERLIRLEIAGPPDSRSELRPFVEALTRDLRLIPEAVTVSERAMVSHGLLPASPTASGPADADATTPTGELAFSVLRKYFAAFMEHEPGVRLGEDPDAVHDMRVATRRMRAALRLFRDALPQRLVIAMNGRLRVLARALGVVRDLELMLSDIRDFGQTLAVTEASALDPLIGILEGRQDEARRGLLRVLDSPRYARLISIGAVQLQKGSDGRAPIAAAPIGLIAPTLVGRVRRDLRKALRRVRRSPSVEGFHDLRIRAKRMRYALEFLLPLYGKPSRETISALVKVQDALGAYQDAEVALDLLRAMIRTQGDRLPNPTSIAIGELAQIYAARARDARRRFRRTRGGLRGRSWRRLKREILDETQRCARRLLRDGNHPVSGPARKEALECDSTSSDTQSQTNATPRDGPTTDSAL